MSNNKIYNVKNRSAGVVVYRVPEMNVRRVFSPGEIKRISFEELEALSFRPGGKELIAEYLQIKDTELLDSINIHAEPEYFMDRNQVEELLRNGSLDAFMDAIDFAPVGVLDMIKELSVSLPLGDYNKRKVLKEKLNFDVDAAIRHMEADAEDEANAPAAQGRRTQPNYNDEASAEVPTGRRTNAQYNIIEE